MGRLNFALITLLVAYISCEGYCLIVSSRTSKLLGQLRITLPAILASLISFEGCRLMLSSRTSKWLGRLRVSFITLLLAFILYSVQIFVIYPWYGSRISTDLLRLLGPFNVLVGLIYWNYLIAVFTDPGGIPDTWKPEKNEQNADCLMERPPYCLKCEKFKPPRAHHCRKCQRCILRMNHHCRWFNNCIGHFTYAHFIRFIFFVDITGMYHVWMLTARALAAYNTARCCGTKPSSTEICFIILNYITCVPLLLSVGVYSIYHFYCLMRNTTFIENWEIDKIPTIHRRREIRQVRNNDFPYDLGIKQNLYTILGPSPLYWIFPTKAMSSGLIFKTVKIEVSSSQSTLLPQDIEVSRSETVHYSNKDAMPRAFSGNIPISSLTSTNPYWRLQIGHVARVGQVIPSPHDSPNDSTTMPWDSDDETCTLSPFSPRFTPTNEYDHIIDREKMQR